MLPTIEEAAVLYAGADPIHAFDHILRVYYMAERLADVEGADREIVLAAALLHDATGTTPGSSQRASHHHQSAEVAREVLLQHGWSEARIAQVQHCIRAHRYRSDGETPQTIEAKVLFDADKLDVLGAVGVARVIGYAAAHGQPAYAQPSEQFLRSGEEEPGEPHSAYHEYLFKLRKIPARLFTAAARQIAEERSRYLEEFFVRFQEESAGIR